MKKSIFMFVGLLTAMAVKSQIATWLIPPAYDMISMGLGADVFIASNGDNKTVWTFDGRQIGSTSDQLFGFSDERAVVVKPGSSVLTGAFALNGSFIPITGYQLSHAYPKYSSGYLLVQDNRFFYFVDKRGKVIQEKPWVTAYPFQNGYAACNTYQNMQKRKNPYWVLLNPKLQPVPLLYNGRAFSPDDISFASSVNDEGKAVVVAKDRVYWFEGKTATLQPLYADELETNPRNQARIDGEIAQSLFQDSDTSSVLMVRCGKAGQMSIRFDRLMAPVAFGNGSNARAFHKKTEQERTVTSPLKYRQENGKFGLNWEADEVLPPQFDRILMCIDNKAVVRLGGKYGLLKVSKDEKFRLTMNKGNDLAFRHARAESTIRVDMPASVPAEKTNIVIAPETGCVIDNTSKEMKNTTFGNYVQCNCSLRIPASLTDEVSQHTYPFHVVYDGLLSPAIPVKINAWYYRYLSVNINEAESSISQGNLSFTFNIEADHLPGEAVYPVTADLVSDSLHYDLEKLSETRYKCKVYGLPEGQNNVVVRIQEQGCPPTFCPFEVTYTKAAAKAANKGAGRGGLTIRKKKEPAQKPATTPHLEI